MNTFLRILSLNAARLLFVGGLLLALYVGLVWALSPDERPDAASIAAAEAAREASEAELASEEADGEATEPPAATTAPTPVETPATVSPQELIAAAKAPADTTVQVLDAGGGSATVDAAITVLEQFGYQIVAVSPSSRDVVETTVYFTEGSTAEAEALRARDPRFRIVEANRGLSEGAVDIHVLVGSEF